MALGDGIRRNIRTVTPHERERFRNGLLALQQTGGDWLDQHGPQDSVGTSRGPGFLPWHRDLCNRYERLLREMDPELSLHYWDWNEDPHELFTPTFLNAGSPDVPFEGVIYGASWTPQDAEILGAETFRQMRLLLEAKHDAAYFVYFGGTFVNAHISFHDPYALLLHSNVDRLFAMWQTQPGRAWRLDAAMMYGHEPATADGRLVVAPPRYDTAAAAGRGRSGHGSRGGGQVQGCSYR